MMAAHDYLRDPDAIYAQSFATIRAEADLARLPVALHAVAIRMIHACGMVDLAADIVGDPRLPAAVEHALGKGEVILCDSEMVAAGIHSRVRQRSVLSPSTIPRCPTSPSASAPPAPPPPSSSGATGSPAPSSSSATPPPRCSICSK